MGRGEALGPRCRPDHGWTGLNLWEFAVEAYARPGVEAALIELQDRHGQSVPFLLWAAGMRPTTRQACEDAAEAAHSWEQAVIGPLRMARRALKSPLPGGVLRQPELRDQAKRLELKAERALIDALSVIGAPGDGPVLRALALAAAAWGRPPPPDRLAALAALLG